jgi:hypothetical protein
MLPFILSIVGGYLIGSSTKEVFEEGGEMAKGGEADLQKKLKDVRFERDYLEWKDETFEEPTEKNRYILMQLEDKSGYGMAISNYPLVKSAANAIKENKEREKSSRKGFHIKIFSVEDILKRESFPDDDKKRIIRQLEEQKELYKCSFCRIHNK